MSNNRLLKSAALLSFAGTLFAGYLTASKIFAGQCAFNETCYYLFGYPTCLYGFVMFLTIFVSSISALTGKVSELRAAKLNSAVSGFGILFSGYYVVRDILIWLGPGEAPSYSLILPTCAYGLVFYIAVFAVSIAAYLQKAKSGGNNL